MTADSLSSSTLARLLSVASPLHERQDFSLSQLVPVHESLLLCQSIQKQQDTADIKNITGLDLAIDASLDDAILARKILEKGSEQQKLLVLQLLCGSINDSLQALATVVLPFLFSHTNTSQDLCEALLDVVFSKNSSLEWLETCFRVCSDGRRQEWTIVCRVLVRLYQATTPCLQVTNFVYDKVMEGVKAATCQQDSLMVLRPIVTWLLPLLFHEEDCVLPERAGELWTCLFSNLESDEASQRVALVQSAVLCSILPSLLHMELPSVE